MPLLTVKLMLDMYHVSPTPDWSISVALGYFQLVGAREKRYNLHHR